MRENAGGGGISIIHVAAHIILASTRENLSSGFVNNNGADQPSHLRRLFHVFVTRILENIIS